ncbi:uncharacterized protein BP5553_06493 [Venustampulla echinocandica]|uniref:Integral membrane protein n=1 Tax=Venustampulla echinocandica TaxID=2656787 RepID=A0A370TK25_9HELO|nr:uncharacterized protein BP5553_06493 [Venustampulla echinocandica]RDL35881.1 hypothetical protein BP5553_06493 [Venustampulla echinocandica]
MSDSNGAIEEIQSGLDSPPSSQSSMAEYATFVKMKTGMSRKLQYQPTKQYRLHNSMLAGVGFLELANVGDFAANVWNEIPIPIYAAVLMGVGGTLALAISVFAVRDAILSSRNIALLRKERYHLRTQREALAAGVEITSTCARGIEMQLDVNFRELGTELVDRFGMDITMGFGAVMVGVGTLMALGGENPLVFHASNLLSGYIGNSPAALYGLLNGIWSFYVLRRAMRHGAAAAKEVPEEGVLVVVKRRLRRVRTHAVINGLTGIVAGAASMVTATYWYGYPVLVPCILSAIFCNYIWRTRIGYDRPLTIKGPDLDKASLLEDLTHAISLQQVLAEGPAQPLARLVPSPKSITSVVDFIQSNDLFEDFCHRLLQDESFARAVLGPPANENENEELILEPSRLLADKTHFPRLTEIAETTVREMGLTRFKYSERYLVEALGCYLCCSKEATPATSQEALISAREEK